MNQHQLREASKECDLEMIERDARERLAQLQAVPAVDGAKVQEVMEIHKALDEVVTELGMWFSLPG